MNYNHFPSNFLFSSGTHQPQIQLPNIINNSQFNQQNSTHQYTGGHGQFQNFYQYTAPQYGHSPNSNFIHNGLIQYPQKSPDAPSVPSKRESKPLSVLDPVNKEVIDLVEISKSLKPISIDESQSNSQNIKASISLGVISSVNSEEHKLYGQDDYKVNYVDTDNLTDYEDDEVCEHADFDLTRTDINENRINGDLMTISDINQNDKDDNINSYCVQSISCSSSIQKKLESLSNGIDKSIISSSENNLKTSYDNCESTDCDKNRLIYSRNCLIELSKSPLCRKPPLNCKEIEVHTNKINDLTNKIISNSTLECSKNGYKPPNKRHNEDSTYLETSRRRFKAILNKIAPQNFALCFSEIKTLIIDTDWSNVDVKEYMECIIDEIFSKAVQEEAYSVTYADLCTEIIKYEEKNNTKWLFKAQLVQRCKDMFDTPLQEQLKTVRYYWDKKIEDESDEKLKTLYKSDIEEQVKKAKDKFFGNIRFIGELYLHDLLKAGIIEICVNTLILKRTDEDAMLSLCKLLETCGKKFDVKHFEKMKAYISTMKEIASLDIIDKRIKFRLCDIIDMSERKWKLRTIQAQKIIKPKTLDQVKQDDINEKYLETSKFFNKSKTNVHKKSNYSSDLRFKSNQNRNQSLEISSIQMHSNKDIGLQPPDHIRWTTGSGVKEDGWRDSKRRFVKSSEKYSKTNHKSIINERKDFSPPKSDFGSRFVLLQPNDFDHINDFNAIIPTESLSEDLEPQPTESSNATSPREQSPADLDADDILLLDGDGIFDKFLDSGILDIFSWSQVNDVSETLTIWVDKIMEKSKLTRNTMGDELAKLIANGQLSLDDLINGVKVFLEDIDDLKTDIPLIWTFLAEFLERFITNSESDISFLKTIFESQWSQTDVLNCISLCLKFANDRLGDEVVFDLFRKCTWSLTDFGAMNEEYLKSRDLIFLLDLIFDPFYFDQYKNDLLVLLSEDVEQIDKYLKENFSSDLSHTRKYVYFVSSSIFSHVIELSEQNIKNYLGNLTLFFLQLINRQSVLEKQMLYALHGCINISENEGLITTVVQYLMDNVLSFDSFNDFCENETIDTIAGRLIKDVIRSMLETP